MRIPKKALLLAATQRGEPEAEAIDFDGTNDYLSRSTDLVGNTDSKTFTFSAWFYVGELINNSYIYVIGSVSAFPFGVRVNASGTVTVLGRTSAGAESITKTSIGTVSANSFNHIVFTADLQNGPWSFYINDTEDSSGTLTGPPIGFSNSSHNIGQYYNGAYRFKSRLAHVYLDYTYRDLSIEANRRLFITADGKPAKGQASLNPILYLPLDDYEAPGVNLGTGGDFTLNGVVAQSGRGPNQWNCVASGFDGVGDYLSSTGIGAGSSNTVTFSFQVTPDLSSAGDVFGAYDGGSTIGMQLRLAQDGTVSISAQNTSGSYLLGSSNTGSFRFTSGKSHSVQFSVDLSDSTKTVLIVNGSAIPISFFQFLDDVFDLNDSFYVASAGLTSNRLNAALGEFYFDTSYIDLATNNPFWDAGAGKPKPVLQVLEETGNTPLIAMPIRADDAGKNYGTGGDFTVNSGPFVGARGASEFWARSVSFTNGTTTASNILENTAPTGWTDSKIITAVFAIRDNDDSYNDPFWSEAAGSYRLIIERGSSGEIRLIASDSAGTQILNVDLMGGTAITANKWYVCAISFDLSSLSLRYSYVTDGTSEYTSPTWAAYTNAQMALGSIDYEAIGRRVDGAFSFLYLTTSYIDFSQEANRLKFVDAFGYPVDIRSKIESGEIPTPLIYMPFDDPNDLGKNLGTGGDFTVNGTVTLGADVDPN